MKQPREQAQEYWLQTGGLVDRWGFERKWPRLHTTTIAREHRPMTGMEIAKRDKRVLIISHGHPTFSLGGGEVASYNLFNGIHDLPGWESFYLARVGPPVNRHKDSALMSLRQKEREILYYANDYDHFRCSNRNLPGLQQDFVRYVVDLQPDVINFHHYHRLGRGDHLRPEAGAAARADRDHLPRIPVDLPPPRPDGEDQPQHALLQVLAGGMHQLLPPHPGEPVLQARSLPQDLP